MGKITGTGIGRWSRGLPLAFLLLGGSVIFSLAMVEGMVRLLGYLPRPSPQPPEEFLTLPDSILGWQNAPGQRSVFHGDGTRVRVTIGERGNRATSEGEHPDGSVQDAVLILGDSVTAGWGIADDETYAWKLQERYPLLPVRNFGVPGYGTVQSYLQLQTLLREGEVPRLVLYAFNDFLADRNVAVPAWLRTLDLTGIRFLPFMELTDSGQLTSPKVARIGLMPGRKILASAALLEDGFQNVLAAERNGEEKVAVTEELLATMAQEAEEHGSPFIVVFLIASPDAKERYAAFLKGHGVPFLDCTFPDYNTPAMQVPGDDHPNGRMNSRFATCIGDHLPSMLGSAG